MTFGLPKEPVNIIPRMNYMHELPTIKGINLNDFITDMKKEQNFTN